MTCTNNIVSTVYFSRNKNKSQNNTDSCNLLKKFGHVLNLPENIKK